MNSKFATFVLCIVAICWGCSYFTMKVCIADMPSFWMIFYRFAIAFLCVSFILLYKFKNITTGILKHSAILGFSSFSIFIFLLQGLSSSSASNAGFLSSTAVVIAPLLSSLFFKKLPNFQNIIALLICFIGIGCLTIKENFTFSISDFFCFLCGVAYAIYILIVDYYSKKHDSLLLGTLQIGFTAIYALIFAVLFDGTPTLPRSDFSLLCLIIMATFCTAFGFVAQVFAQKYTNTITTSLCFSLEPLSSAFFGHFVLSENMSIAGYIGGVLVLCSVIYAAFIRNK